MKHSRHARRTSGRWQPLERAAVVPISEAEIRTRMPFYRRSCPDLSEAKIREFIADMDRQEVWTNDRYQVHVIRSEEIVHLSIRRLDRSPARDWRDFQRIKNQLVGPESEGVELYPAESRVVDIANQFHLWVVPDSAFRFQFGFDAGRHVGSESGAGSVQRPIED